MAEFWQKHEQNPYTDLYWNLPEQKQGRVAVVGGNGQNFRTPVRVAEYLAQEYPVKEVRLVLPDVLKGKLPPLDNLALLGSTESGSLADAEGLERALASADWSLVVGDLTKNAITARAVMNACANAKKPLLITRDAVDLVATPEVEGLMMREEVAFFASLPQVMKLLRTVYYPKMLTLSQPLTQVVEVLHKFTLSYPVGLITLCDGQVLAAKDGKVETVAITATGYSPLTIWGGTLTARIVALNLYNPGNFLAATVAGVWAR